MLSRYTKYYEFLDLTKTFPEDFLQIFEDLLVQSNGNIDRVLNFLQRYNNVYGFFKSENDIQRFKEQLIQNGLVSKHNQRHELSQKGKQWLRERIFKHFFKRIKMNNEGQHPNKFSGNSILDGNEIRAFKDGDDFRRLDLRSSWIKHSRRNRSTDWNYDDLLVYDSRSSSTLASVLLIDISHSMILYGEDRITPAKKVALALCELIKKKYPNDKLHVCVFGDDVKEIPLKDLDKITVGPYHTNTLAALQMAKKILKKYPHMDKQIIMITDGKPTCVKEGMRLIKNSFGLDPFIVNKVLKEAMDCRKQKINLTTFMLTQESYLKEFVDEMTLLSNGRAFHVNVFHLSNSVIIDYLKHRKKRYR